MKWYIARCPTGAEENAIKDLKFILSKMNILDDMGEYLVPYERKRARTLRRNVANYVFIQLNMHENMIEAFGKSKIISLMLDENLNPITVAQEEIDNMQNTIAKKKMEEEEIEYLPGQTVKVLEAPFEDFNAIVEKVDKNKQILTVSVPILGRQVSLELPFNSIKRITE